MLGQFNFVLYSWKRRLMCVCVSVCWRWRCGDRQTGGQVCCVCPCSPTFLENGLLAERREKKGRGKARGKDVTASFLPFLSLSLSTPVWLYKKRSRKELKEIKWNDGIIKNKQNITKHRNCGREVSEMCRVNIGKTNTRIKKDGYLCYVCPHVANLEMKMYLLYFPYHYTHTHTDTHTLTHEYTYILSLSLPV